MTALAIHTVSVAEQSELSASDSLAALALYKSLLIDWLSAVSRAADYVLDFVCLCVCV